MTSRLRKALDSRYQARVARLPATVTSVPTGAGYVIATVAGQPGVRVRTGDAVVRAGTPLWVEQSGDPALAEYVVVGAGNAAVGAGNAAWNLQGIDDTQLVRRSGVRSLYATARWLWESGAEVSGVFRSWGAGMLQIFGRLFVGSMSGARIEIAETLNAVYRLRVVDADSDAVLVAAAPASSADGATVEIGRPGYPRIAFGALPGFDRQVPLVDARLVIGDLQQVGRAAMAALLRLAFSFISWAGIGIIETFENESQRVNPEPGTYPAAISSAGLSNGGDSTPNRMFTWTSKTFEDVGDCYHGVSTGVAEGVLYDVNATWFDDQYRNYELVDANGTVFTIITSLETPMETGRRLLVSGTPAAGAYTIRFKAPSLVVAMVYYQRAGGDIQIIATLDAENGANEHWLPLLDTANNVDNTGGAIRTDEGGRCYRFQIQLKNDANGVCPVVAGIGIFTDPAVWT